MAFRNYMRVSEYLNLRFAYPITPFTEARCRGEGFKRSAYFEVYLSLVPRTRHVVVDVVNKVGRE